MSLMGLDVGTTGCKAVVFDERLRVLAQAYREYALSHPRDGWVEMPPETIWGNVLEVMLAVNARVQRDPVRALAISCHGEAVAPVDARGAALRNFIITFDNRTGPQCEWWRNALGSRRVFEITGMPLHPMYSLNKIMWIREHEPEVFDRAWKFLCVEDYLVFRLCGEAGIAHSLAARTMAFDVTRRRWSGEMLKAAGLEEERLATPQPSGTGLGHVRPEVAGRAGFTGRVLVVAGGHDQPCGALGAGVAQPGMAMNATGTSDVLCPVFAQPVLTPSLLASNLCCYPHVDEDRYCSIAFNLSGGLLLRWYRDGFCHEEREMARASGKDPYDIIFANLHPEPADVFVLPHLVGAGTPHLDPDSRGAILGLGLETDKPRLARAMVDGINYELKLNLDRYEAAGVPIRELRAVGGGAKSPKWLQMKADVFGRPVAALENSEAAAAGAAILAGKGLGTFPSAAKASARHVTPTRIYEPDAAAHQRYQERFKLYSGIYELLQPFYRNLRRSP